MTNSQSPEQRTHEPVDPGCICHGVWRRIVLEHLPLVGRKYRHSTGAEYRLFGLVHGERDYYFGLYGKAGLELAPCAQDLARHGFELKPKTDEDAVPERFRPAPAQDSKCICRGNWRQLVRECKGLLGKRFRDEKGQEFVFFGPVDGEDDYYYGMHGGSGMALLSCVGALESFGFALVPERPVSAASPR